MALFKKSILLLSIAYCYPSLYSQQKDSIPQKTIAFITDKFPITRVLNIEYNRLAPYHYSSTFLNENLSENKIDNWQQAKISANIPLVTKRQWHLSYLLNYRFTAADITLSKSTATENSFSSLQKFHYHSSAISIAYFSKLFNKMVIYSGSFIADGSEKHVERFRGLATANLVVKANQQTKMAVGLAAMIDPTVQIPVIATFSYEHRFNNNWIIDLVLPKRAYLKKNILSNGRISIGSELESTSFYMYQLNGISKKYEYRQTEINSGIMYEHYLGNSCVITFKSGLQNVITGRIFEKNKSFNSYILEAKPKPTVYFQAGFSFNPFMKSSKK